MSINHKNFEYIKARGEELYKSLQSIHCPYFNELVHFNADGLEHLKFKRREVERILQDQYMRFKLLHLAPQVLKLSRTVQGRSHRKCFERVRQNNRTFQIFCDIFYFEFIAIIDDVRVRIIVRQLQGGQLNFWSIIPYWEQASEHKRLFGFGNPEED